MRRYHILLLIVFSGSHLAGQGKILFETNGNSVSLRWQGSHLQGLPSYNVYRKQDGGGWAKVTSEPLKPILDYATLKGVLKFKTDAYLQMFGLSGEKQESISRISWDSSFRKPGAEPFIGAMGMINREYAVALGETFTDAPSDKYATYAYRITCSDDLGAEREIGVIEGVKPMQVSKVPDVTDLKAIPGDRKVRLEWKKEKDLMKKGLIVTYQVYSASDILGPYEPVNFYGIMSISVQSGGRTTSEQVESFTVDYLENGKTMYFMVKAVNAFGTESQGGVTVFATPEDPKKMAAPKNLKITMGTGMAALTWDGDKRAVVYRTDSRKKQFEQVYPPKGAVLAPGRVWYDRSIVEGKEYWYTARTMDESGNIGAEGDTVYLFVPDITSPAAPVHVQAIAKKGLITITWDPNKETDVLGYEIERASDKNLLTRFLLTRKPTAATSWKDTLDYLSQTRFGYVVYCIDKSYNRSKPSSIVVARMPDFEPPARPLILTLAEVDTSISITWMAPPDKDIALYRIYRKSNAAASWNKVGETRKLVFNERAIAGMYYYSVSAVDSAGNESQYAIQQGIAVKAAGVLKPPVAGRADTVGGSIVINWSPAKGAQSSGWVVSRVIDGKRIDVAQLEAEVTTFEDAWPVEGKIIYEVRSRNDDWQMSPPLIIEVNYKR